MREHCLIVARGGAAAAPAVGQRDKAARGQSFRARAPASALVGMDWLLLDLLASGTHVIVHGRCTWGGCVHEW
jgi:hypothetical protein